MFAARANQENAIYEQQTAAAAKPLNQGVKGLAPKTPGNAAPPKTPFKRGLNDENAKTGGKGKQGALFGEGKSGKVDASAFVTPAGPRNRAPLGNKTTNAKATAFQTPGPAPLTEGKLSAKPSSPRMRRGKIRVHEAEIEGNAEEAEEREIEFMPPREVPLPDHPDDWPLERTYPQFEGKNLTRGWYSEFSAQKEEGEEEFSDFEEKLKKVEELNAKKKQAAQQQQAKKSVAVVRKSPMQKTTRDPLASKPAQGLTARGAAAALGKPATSSRFAAPTAAAKAKVPSAAQSKKPVSATAGTGNTRHTVAKVASNSTLGYSKGRAVSDYKRQPLAGLYGEQPSASGSHGAKGSLNELFGLQDLDIKDEDADLGLFDTDANDPPGIEEEEVFQLDSVEL